MVLKLSPLRLLIILVVVLFLSMYFGCLKLKIQEGLDIMPVTYVGGVTPSATTPTPTFKNSIKFDRNTGLDIHLEKDFISNSSKNLFNQVSKIGSSIGSSDGYKF